jgi:hypothetical protein
MPARGRFIASFAEVNHVDLDDLGTIERVFATEIRRFERGPAKLLKELPPGSQG